MYSEDDLRPATSALLPAPVRADPYRTAMDGKQEERVHPFLEEKMAIGLFAYGQALLLARLLRGELDGYPPVIWK